MLLLSALETGGSVSVAGGRVTPAPVVQGAGVFWLEHIDLMCAPAFRGSSVGLGLVSIQRNRWEVMTSDERKPAQDVSKTGPGPGHVSAWTCIRCHQRQALLVGRRKWRICGLWQCKTCAEG